MVLKKNIAVCFVLFVINTCFEVLRVIDMSILEVMNRCRINESEGSLPNASQKYF